MYYCYATVTCYDGQWNAPEWPGNVESKFCPDSSSSRKQIRVVRVPSILRYLEVYGNVNCLPHGTIWFKVVCRYCWQEEDSLTHSGSRDDTTKKNRPIKLDFSVQVWSVNWTRTYFQHDVDTYVDTMYWHTAWDSVQERRTCDMVRGSSFYMNFRQAEKVLCRLSNCWSM